MGAGPRRALLTVVSSRDEPGSGALLSRRGGGRSCKCEPWVVVLRAGTTSGCAQAGDGQPGSAVREGRVSVASAPGVASSPRPLKPGAELLCCVQIHKTGSSRFLLSPKQCCGGRPARGRSCSPPWCHRTNGRWAGHSGRPAGPPRTRRRGSAPGASCEW